MKILQKCLVVILGSHENNNKILGNGTRKPLKMSLQSLGIVQETTKKTTLKSLGSVQESHRILRNAAGKTSKKIIKLIRGGTGKPPQASLDFLGSCTEKHRKHEHTLRGGTGKA